MAMELVMHRRHRVSGRYSVVFGKTQDFAVINANTTKRKFVDPRTNSELFLSQLSGLDSFFSSIVDDTPPELTVPHELRVTQSRFPAERKSTSHSKYLTI